MTTVSTCDGSCVQSLVSGLALIYTLVDWTVDTWTLSLTLGVGFKLTLRFRNQWLIKLFLVLSSHSVLNHTLPLVGDWIWFWISSTVLLYWFCYSYPPIINWPIKFARLDLPVHVRSRWTQSYSFDVTLWFFLYTLTHFWCFGGCDAAHHLRCVYFILSDDQFYVIFWFVFTPAFSFCSVFGSFFIHVNSNVLLILILLFLFWKPWLTFFVVLLSDICRSSTWISGYEVVN